jgi:predicted nucleic acid-binding protein
VTEALVLDASFALHWCFEDEVTAETEAVLSSLQKQETTALVPTIWAHEILNGLGKGVTRGRIERAKAFELWDQIRHLPVEAVDTLLDGQLLALALEHDLAVYDAAYLSLAVDRHLPVATADGKLGRAAANCGLAILSP